MQKHDIDVEAIIFGSSTVEVFEMVPKGRAYLFLIDPDSRELKINPLEKTRVINGPYQEVLEDVLRLDFLLESRADECYARVDIYPLEIDGVKANLGYSIDLKPKSIVRVGIKKGRFYIKGFKDSLEFLSSERL